MPFWPEDNIHDFLTDKNIHLFICCYYISSIKSILKLYQMKIVVHLFYLYRTDTEKCVGSVMEVYWFCVCSNRWNTGILIPRTSICLPRKRERLRLDECRLYHTLVTVQGRWSHWTEGQRNWNQAWGGRLDSITWAWPFWRRLRRSLLLLLVSPSQFWLFLHRSSGFQRGRRRPVRSLLRTVTLPLVGSPVRSF